MVYRYAIQQTPSLRCGVTNKKETKLHTHAHSALDGMSVEEACQSICDRCGGASDEDRLHGAA
jgi:hypothetical protein